MKVCIKSNRGYYQGLNNFTTHNTHGRFVKDKKWATKYDRESEEDKIRWAMHDVLSYYEIPELEMVEDEK